MFEYSHKKNYTQDQSESQAKTLCPNMHCFCVQ